MAECVFFNPGEKPHACTSELKLAGWFLLIGLGANAFIFACLTFVPSPSVCPSESGILANPKLSAANLSLTLCFFCIGMQIPGNCEIHPAYERWMQHRSPGGCAGIPALHALGRAGCREPWAGGKADLNPLASLHLASAPQSHKSASAAPGFHHRPDKTQLSFMCEMNPGELESRRNNTTKLQIPWGE